MTTSILRLESFASSQTLLWRIDTSSPVDAPYGVKILKHRRSPVLGEYSLLFRRLAIRSPGCNLYLFRVARVLSLCLLYCTMYWMHLSLSRSLWRLKQLA